MLKFLQNTLCYWCFVDSRILRMRELTSPIFSKPRSCPLSTDEFRDMLSSINLRTGYGKYTREGSPYIGAIRNKIAISQQTTRRVSKSPCYLLKINTFC